MTVAAFLRELEQRGVVLAAEGDSLTLRAPKGALTEADRDRLHAEKAGILAWLQQPGDDDEPFPLTDIQQAYLVGRAAELDLGRVGCHAYREFDATGLDLQRLEDAWNRLVARHPMLRTVCTADGMQRTLPTVPHYRIALATIDDDATLQHLRDSRSHHVFDPTHWPLFAIHATSSRGRILLSVGIDLLVADAAALITLFTEWGALYSGHTPPPPPGRFRDHVRQLPPPSATDRAYWEARLDTLPAGPDLPSLPLVGLPRFGRRTIRVDAPEWHALKRTAAAHGLTSSALIAAIYADTLAGWSRRARFCLTMTYFAAPPDMAGVVGDFTSTVLLEADSTPAGFLDRAQALQRRLLEGLDHAGMSGVAVLRERRRRHPDAEPVAVVFTSTLGHPGLDPAKPSPLAWLGPTLHAITQTPQVAMDHHVMEEAGGLVASWDVLEARFPPGVVDAMVAAYAALLDALVSGHGWDHPVPAPAATTPEPAHPPATLHAAFERQAAATPTAIAVVAPGRTLDYQTLDRAAGHLAATIATRLGGPARDRLVAIQEAKGWRQVVAVLAVLKAGAAYLPVDPTLPPDRRRHLIEHGDALPLTDADVDAALAQPGPPSALEPPDPDRLAYVIYTSGSTGMPKGVMVEHRAAWGTIAEVNRRWSLVADDCVLGLSALSFDLSVWDIFGPLSVGAALVLPPPDAARDPAQWGRLITEHHATIWNSVPALLALLVEHGLPPGHNLRLALLSGDWVPLDLVRRLHAGSPATALVALGGATEAAIWSNAHDIGPLDPAWPSIPYGAPLAGQRLHIVNERGTECPPWVTGEIEISGAGLARGYWRDPARTAERFVHRGEQRRYRTGDLGRLRPYHGRMLIEFLGREDNQVKVGGHRIELGEIEATIAAHPEVAHCAVVALPTPADPDGRTLQAFVVPIRQSWDRVAFLLERHSRKPLAATGRIPLPHRPSPAAYDARRTVRRFAPGPVPLDALATLLAAMPTEMGIMIESRAVTGLPPGRWRHDPPAHRLLLEPPVASAIPDAPTAAIAASAAFIIELHAPETPDALIAAGALGQRLMHAAHASGLGLCPIGVRLVDGAPVLHSFAGGAPATEAAGFDLAGTLREHCAATLPAYMTPRHIHLRDALPLTPNGKLDRAALQPPAPPAAPAPAGDALLQRVAGDALLQRVADAVASVLGHPVHPQQNLFDCGATSLHIVRLHRLLAEDFASPLELVDLFRLPSVAALAATLGGAVAADPVAAGLARAERRRQLRGRPA